MKPPEMLAKAIELSGLPLQRFATEVLLRDERTVRRWLAGPETTSGSPIPAVVVAYLKKYLREGKP